MPSTLPVLTGAKKTKRFGTERLVLQKDEELQEQIRQEKEARNIEMQAAREAREMAAQIKAQERWQARQEAPAGMPDPIRPMQSAPLPVLRPTQPMPQVAPRPVDTRLTGGQIAMAPIQMAKAVQAPEQVTTPRDALGLTAEDYNSSPEGYGRQFTSEYTNPRFGGIFSRYGKGKETSVDEAAKSRLSNYAQKNVLTKEEGEDFKNLAFSVAKEIEGKIANSTVTDEDIALLNQIDAIRNKARIESGIMTMENPDGSFTVENTAKPMTSALETAGKAFNDAMLRLPMLLGRQAMDEDTQAALDAVLADREQEKSAHPVANMAGTMGANMLMYGGINSLAEGAGLTGALAGKLGDGAAANFAARQAVGLAPDILVDTIPTEIQNAQNGMTGRELLADTLKNVGVNAAFNFAADIPSLSKDIREAKQALPSIAVSENTADSIKAFGDKDLSALENPTNPILMNNQGEIAKNATRYTSDIAIEMDQARRGMLEGKDMIDFFPQDSTDLFDEKTLNDFLSSHKDVKTVSNALPKSKEQIAEETRSVAGQLNKFLRGEMKENELLVYGETPEILKEFGVEGDYVVSRQEIISKLLRPQARENMDSHGLGIEGVMKIPDAISHPAAIAKSRKDGKIVLLLDYGTKNKTPLYSTVTVGQDGNIGFESRLTSAHARGNAIKQFTQDKDLDVKYIRKKDASLPGYEATIAQTGKNASLLNKSIEPDANSVNNYAGEIAPLEQARDTSRALEAQGIPALQQAERAAEPVPALRQATEQTADALKAAQEPVVEQAEEVAEQIAKGPSQNLNTRYEEFLGNFFKDPTEKDRPIAEALSGFEKALKAGDVDGMNAVKEAAKGTVWENDISDIIAGVKYGDDALTSEATRMRRIMPEADYDRYADTIHELHRNEEQLNAALNEAFDGRMDPVDAFEYVQDSQRSYDKIQKYLVRKSKREAELVGIQYEAGAKNAHQKWAAKLKQRRDRLKAISSQTESQIEELRHIENALLYDKAQKDVYKEGQKAWDGYTALFDEDSNAAKAAASKWRDEHPRAPRSMALEMEQPHLEATPEEIARIRARNAAESTAEIPETAGQRLTRAAMEGDTEVPRGRTYQSQTFTNSVRNSNNWDQDLLNELNDRVVFESVSEKESVAAGVKRLAENWDEEIGRFTKDASEKSAKELQKSYNSKDIDEMFIAAQELRKRAATATDPALKAQYNAQAQEIALNITKAGHDAGSNLQALAKWTRTADGAVTTAEGIVEKQVADVLQSNKGLAEGIDDVAGAINDRLRAIRETEEWNELVQGALDAQENAARKDTLRTEIEDMIRDAISKNKAVSGRVDEDGIRRLADSVMNERELVDVERHLEFLSTGFEPVKPETIDRVYDLFDEAQKLNVNSKERVRIEREAFALLAGDLGVGQSFGDKLNTWRYLSMLGNPRTHIRNIVGNAGFKGVTDISDNVSAIAQNFAERLSGGRFKAERAVYNTFSATDRANANTAKSLVDDYFYRRLSDGNKWTGAANEIMKSGEAFSNNNPLGRAINWLADKNSGALDLEDYFALKNKFGRSMAQRMKQAGITADELTNIVKNMDDSGAVKSLVDPEKAQLVNQMVDAAIEDAKYATFHSDNGWGAAMSRALSRASQNTKEFANSGGAAKKALGTLGNVVIEGTVPFKKTPGNILQAGVDYSPLGALFGSADLAKAVKNKDGRAVMSAIDDLTKGLTGSAIMALGAYMYDAGVISSSGNEDDRLYYYDQMQGKQKYAINIPIGKDTYSYTIDWAAPEVMPLLVGAELWRQAADGGEMTPADFVDAVMTIGNPLVDTSMLQGISNGISAIANTSKGNQDSAVMRFAANTAAGFLGQLVPTIGGSVSRTIDPYRRNTWYSQNTGTAKEIDNLVSKTKGKIPGLAETNNKYIDMWGRETYNTGGDNIALRAAQNFLSPGYIQRSNVTDLDERLNALIEESGNSKVAPTLANQSITLDGEKRKLTKDEYEGYSKVAGQLKYDLLDSLTQEESFNSMSAEDRAKTVEDMYSLANAISAKEYFGDSYSTTTENQKMYDTYKEGGIPALVDYQSKKMTLNSAGLKATEANMALAEEHSVEEVVGYAAARKTADTDGGSSPTIQEIIDYMASNPDAPEWYAQEMGAGKEGTFTQQNGEWVYKDKNGKIKKTATGAKVPSLKNQNTATETQTTGRYKNWAEGEPRQEQTQTTGVPVLNFDIASSNSYSRFQKVPGINTSTDNYATIYGGMDADGNGRLKKVEIMDYLDASSYSDKQKKALFEAYKTSRMKNPY